MNSTRLFSTAFMVAFFASCLGAHAVGAPMDVPGLVQIGGIYPSNSRPFPPCPIFNPMASVDTSQIPAGTHGIRPIGEMEDGLPVYGLMPVFDEVPGAFVVQISSPINDFISIPMWIKVPKRGRAREAFRRKLEAWLIKADYASRLKTAWDNVSGRRRAQLAEDGKNEAECGAKAQAARDREHQRQCDLRDRLFYHMNDRQLEFYRQGNKPLVSPVGGRQYGTPNLMESPGGDVYDIR